MKNKDFVLAVINSYRSAIKQTDVPPIYLTKGNTLQIRPTYEDIFNIMANNGMYSGKYQQNIANIIAFEELIKINRKEIKKEFIDRGYYFEGWDREAGSIPKLRPIFT